MGWVGTNYTEKNTSIVAILAQLPNFHPLQTITTGGWGSFAWVLLFGSSHAHGNFLMERKVDRPYECFPLGSKVLNRVITQLKK